jgi:hypothetical protein
VAAPSGSVNVQADLLRSGTKTITEEIAIYRHYATSGGADTWQINQVDSPEIVYVNAQMKITEYGVKLTYQLTHLGAEGIAVKEIRHFAKFTNITSSRK